MESQSQDGTGMNQGYWNGGGSLSVDTPLNRVLGRGRLNGIYLGDDNESSENNLQRRHDYLIISMICERIQFRDIIDFWCSSRSSF